MKQTLHFSISGDFITNIARQWLWDEHRPYEKCRELLIACLGGMPEEEKESTAIAILEGRKRLTGTNTVELVDDNKNIRPLSEYIRRIEHEKAIAIIKQDMEHNFSKYVDHWSTVKSSHRDVLTFEWYGNTIEPQTHDECTKYYTTLNGRTLYEQIDSPTACGLWLYYYPELVAKAANYELNNVGTPEFWANIYKETITIKDFDARNAKYRAYLRMSETTETTQMHIEDQDKKESTTKPDNYTDRFAIISPTGEYYSCGYGEHNHKAWEIMLASPEKFGINIPKNTPPETYLNTITSYDKALDEILKHGWCALRWNGNDGDNIRYPNSDTITKDQENAIFDAMVKFNLSIDMEDVMSHTIEKLA